MPDSVDTSMIISIKEDIATLTETVKNVFKQLESQIERQRCDANSIKDVEIVLAKIDTKIGSKFDQIDGVLKDLTERVKKIEGRPAKAVWLVVSNALTAVTVFVVNYVLRDR